MKLSAPAVALITLCVAAPAHATTITLAAMLEGYVTIFPSGVTEGPYPPDAFGTFVGELGRLQSGTPALPTGARAVYEFDLGAIDPASVTGAVFSFVPTDIATFGFTCFDFTGCPTLPAAEVLSYTGDGVLERGDYHSGTAFVGRTAPVPGTPVSFNATTAVRNSTTGFSGFTINAGAPNGAIGVTQAALQVEYDAAPVPEPATFAIVGGGLIALAAVLRRTRRR